MARICTVCTHAEREAIDTALVAGESCHSLAERYSTLGRMALQRHKDNHLPAAMVQAQGAAELAHADSLLDQVKDLQTRALAILAKAESAGDLRTALGAIREARANIELLARLLGELQDGQTVNVLVASQEWIAMRGAIMRALEPYQPARLAVAEVLQHVTG